MAGLRLWLLVAVAALAAPRAQAGEDAAKTLAELDAQIKKAPGDPALHYRRALCLMKLARHNEGHDAAKKAMEAFVNKGINLPWLRIEEIDLGSVKVDVHLNKGPRERRPPQFGIVRPLSFRILKKGDAPTLVETIDFEIGMLNGKPGTVALGMQQGRAHANFGMLDKDAKYDQIRKKALALIKARHPDPAP